MPRKLPTPPVTAASRAARLALTPRQALFVDLYGGREPGQPALSAAEAARRAGYSSRGTDSIAARVLKIPKVAIAVKLKQAAAAERADNSFDGWIAEVDELIVFAKSTNNASAAMQGIIAKGKALGHLIERVDARVAQGSFQIVIERWPPPDATPALAGITGE